MKIYKKLKTVELKVEISEDTFVGPVTEIIFRLQNYCKSFPVYQDFSIAADSNWDGLTSFKLLGTRLETDKEYAHRVKQLEQTKINTAKYKEKVRAQELELLQKLKSKYEKVT